LDVEERETFELLSAVDQKRLDVAFVRTTGSRFTALASHVLHEEDFVAAIPAQHRLAGDSTAISLSALMQENLVLYRRPDGVGIFDVLMEALRSKGFTPLVVKEVPRILAAINLVAAGEGISLVPASMRVVHTESVVYRPLVAGSLPPMPLTLVYRRDDPPALVRNFIDVARQAAAD
jgi:DNA-binding transcriptional LysR family regulator